MRKNGVFPVVMGLCLFLAPYGQGQENAEERRFASSRWLEVESSPVLLYDDTSNPENNNARVVAPGGVTGYELGCVSMRDGRPSVSSIVDEDYDDKPLRAWPAYTRQMLEVAAYNLCGEGEGLGFVSVSFADGARWNMYGDKKPKRSKAEFNRPTTWWRAKGRKRN